MGELIATRAELNAVRDWLKGARPDRNPVPPERRTKARAINARWQAMRRRTKGGAA